ncbi:MAG: hypothetical protein F7C38_07210 [Desulfurococcales archaeon]|nr:hypothetical protein [Desulfurococcales archaeon]
MSRRRSRGREIPYRVPRDGVDLELLYKLYYSLRPRIEEPSDIAHREFAFQYFDSETYHRHLSFNSIDEVLDHMTRRPPRQAYYSVATYELPEAKSMEEKVWLGSDLFFDIDVDHLPGCQGPLPTTECIMEGLRMAYRIRAVAKRDLGAEATRIYFTGHRGFHVVVYCSECRTLGRSERREIAQYIAARGLEPEALFPLRPPRGYEPALPGEGEPGWRGWIAEGLGGRRGGARRVLGRNWLDEILEIVRDLAVDLDLQVTQDPTRLLRLEGTLNGKASLLAARVGESWRPSYGDLTPFQGEVGARCLVEIPEGEYYGFKGGFREGEEASLPAGIAIVFETKGICRIIEGEIVVRAGTGWGRV